MKTKFYDVAETIKESPNTRLFFIVGQRGVGKSYSVKKWCIKDYLKNKLKFVYVRRWTTEIQGGVLRSVFEDIVTDKEIDWTPIDPKGEFYCFHILPKSAYFYIVGEKTDGSMVWIEPIGRIVALSKSEAFKGGTYNDYSNIFFDEFISETNGLKNEMELFSKIINTVGRGVNKNLRIFCCGNPDYSIELNPMLQGLHLDYAHLQDNTNYYFDSQDENGKRIANNILFIKLANFKGEYLNNVTSHLFGTAEEMMSATGEVKKQPFIHNENYNLSFKPFYELEVETPILCNDLFHKKLYIYYGEMWGEPVMVAEQHRKYKVPSLFCRYDKTDFRKRPTRQTYRINIPPMEEYSQLKRLMAMVDANQLIISNEDATATLFLQIRENS